MTMATLNGLSTESTPLRPLRRAVDRALRIIRDRVEAVRVAQAYGALSAAQLDDIGLREADVAEAQAAASPKRILARRYNLNRAWRARLPAPRHSAR